MKLNLLGFFLGITVTSSVMAFDGYKDYNLSLNTGMGSSWNFNFNTANSTIQGMTATPGQIIIGGGLGIVGNQGIPREGQSGHEDHRRSHGFTAMIARKIVAHGGYFCPTQVQCATNSGTNAWSEYFHLLTPSGGRNNCEWLCEAGYTGENCVSYSADDINTAFCDHAIYRTGTGQKFAGYDSVRTTNLTGWTSASQQIKTVTEGFKYWDEGVSGKEKNIVVALYEYHDHSLAAAPIYIECNKDRINNNQVGWVQKVSTLSNAMGGTGKRLCPQGYFNGPGMSCIPHENCTAPVQPTEYCVGYSEEDYEEDIHTYLYDSENNCAKFKCEEELYGFADVEDGDFSCVSCAVSRTGASGVSHINGECVKCGDREIFNTSTSTCDEMVGFSRLDLQYGLGQTNNSTKVSEQCWILSNPNEYRNCVIGSVEKYTGPVTFDEVSALERNDSVDIGDLTAAGISAN